MKEAARVVFTFEKCPHGFKALALSDGEGGGTRLTSGKCCGTWTTVESFVVDGEDVIEEVTAQMDANVRRTKEPNE